MTTKYLIIGAGLSGLTAANELLKKGETDFLILEARAEAGGRVLTDRTVDLGATWFQNHHLYLSKLIDELNIDSFDQYSIGKSVLVYNTMAPAHYFESDTSGPAAQRVTGGSVALIEKLQEHCKEKIIFGEVVVSISEEKQILRVETNNGEFISEKVIITIPPNLASGLQFSPKLPLEVLNAMQKTHTWMSNAIKVGITFKSAFWRDKELSGTIIGQVGPVIELYDHSNKDNTAFSLMGFVNEGLRDVSSEERKEKILAYLELYLGKGVRDYTHYFEKDWSKDSFTSADSLKSIYMSPSYGNPVFTKFYMNGKLLFSGTETSPEYGGYLEGAVRSGLIAANKILEV